ncbi:sensor histidine kinase [Nocardioides allogilvus]|uniref:sensor histidine kinase n=1 Tax=Nocardioides allogilvus TaxID=2072017 RepID=UPI000D2FFE1D|nr:histidine kinase [Nocardioides allogilvus]
MTTAEPASPGPHWLGDALQVGLAVLLAFLLLPVGLTSVREGDTGSAWTVVLLAALCVLHALVAVAHRWPREAFAVGGLAMLALVAGPDLGGPTAVQAGGEYAPVLLPTCLVFFVLLYAVAAHAAQPWPTIALGVTLVGCLLTVVRLWDSEFVLPVSAMWVWRLFLTVSVLGGTAAAWALGRYRATRIAWIGALADRGAADERRRIAREMHDVVAHSLAVMVAQAEGGRMAVAASPERAPEILTSIATSGREALAEMRGLLGVLRDDSSPAPPQPTLADLPDLVEQVRAAGLRVDLATTGEPLRLPVLRELAAYRVVQEALTNVVKHAPRDSTATVALAWEPTGLGITISNDDDSPPAGDGQGRGLVGMRERIEAVGGSLVAGPVDGGWRVSARIPA